MSKIKVCHIITKLELGGAQQNTLHTVGHLERETFAPVLISGTGGILDPLASSLEGVNVHFVPELARSINPFKDIMCFFKVKRILSGERPDIVHTHSSKAGIIGRWAAAAAGVPVIVHTYHGFGFNDFQSWPVRKLFIWLERVSAPLAHRLIAVTAEDIAKGLRNGIGEKGQYAVIRSGINVGKFTACRCDRETKKKELGINPRDKIVSTIGPFKPQKNLGDFIRVARVVAEQRTDVTFLVVGDGRQRPQLEELIVRHRLAGQVRLLGWRKDIDEILCISDVFAMTSLWEGLPRSLLEAMCAGLPVVANGVDGVREVVREGRTGFLVRPFDIARTAELLLLLLGDGRLAREMGESGRRMIGDEYDIDRMVRQQETLYRELVGK